MNEKVTSFTDNIIESIQNAFIEIIDEMVFDVMKLKSFSQGEAMVIVLNCLSKGIAPKSDEFYEYVNNYKTLWEQ